MATLFNSVGTSKTVKPKLDKFQLNELLKLLNGSIEIIPLEKRGLDKKFMIVNQNRNVLNLLFNKEATDIWKKYYGLSDYVLGPALICNESELKFYNDFEIKLDLLSSVIQKSKTVEPTTLSKRILKDLQNYGYEIKKIN